MSAATARRYQPSEEPREPATPPRPPVGSGRSHPHLSQPRSDRAVVDPPPAPVTAPRTPFVVLVLLLVAVGIVGLLVLNTKINENSFQLEGLRDRQAALDIREQTLRSKLAENQSPGNLAAMAKRLGLVPAGSQAFLRLPDGQVIGMPRPGGGDRTGNGG